MLQGKKIVVGVTGGIAAYKTAHLVRLLIKAGAEVQVIMTEHARHFITPLTMATLSKRSILVDFFNPENGDWNSHVDIGLWADAFVVAPATANTIAKMVNGIADNLLLTTYLSVRCPVIVAPAMDLDMYSHQTTQSNIEKLSLQGVTIVAPTMGELASGLSGKGRMEEPENIVSAIVDMLTPKLLKGKKIVVNAGPTYENIDPVRFIGNYSSGKMGFAIAEVCANYGAEVTLVAGPVKIDTPHTAIHRIDVKSAEEMYLATVKAFATADGAILSAAVADFTPENRADQKLKRSKEKPSHLTLVPTKDIAQELGKIKKEGQFLVGFALETNNEAENATNKLKKKNLDFIVLNSLQDENAGFDFDTNKITVMHRNGEREEYPLKSKKEVAHDIVGTILKGNFIHRRDGL